jgi:peroxiredoxin family protein/TusA-related sulfurtransferase
MTENLPTYSLDCKGKLCPAPILELAKLVKKNSDPAYVVMLATDDNFPADLEAWCRSTQNRLLHISPKQSGVYTAKIQIGKLSTYETNKNPITPTSVDSDATNISIEIPEPDKVVTRIEPAPLKSAKAVYTPERSNPNEKQTTADGLEDLCGLSAEQALLQLSTALLQAKDGELQAISDAPNFSEKVRAWSELVNAELVDLQRFGVKTRVFLRRGVGRPPISNQIVEKTPQERASLCVMHNSFEALYVAMMMANSSASQGLAVDIFFCFWGVALLRAEKPKPKPPSKSNFLTRFFQGVIQWLTPKGPKKQNLQQLHFGGIGDQMLGYIIQQKQAQTLEQLVQSAVEQRVRFLVCATSLGLLGLEKEDLLDLPNIEIAGMTAFTEVAKRGSFSFTF